LFLYIGMYVTNCSIILIRRGTIMKKPYVLVLAALLLAGMLINCTSKLNMETAQALDTALQAAVDSTGGKGLTAAVIFTDGSMWTGAAGISHEGEYLTPEHRFSAGSIGKMFTAAAVLQLCSEGRLSLDEPIYKKLPSFRNIDSTITIRQLLSHTSGLADFADNRMYWNSVFNENTTLWALDDMLKTFTEKPLFAKGEDWNYATTNYVLLRNLVQEICRKPVNQVYKERFFEPLGMIYSSASLDSTLPELLAHGWLDMDGDGVYDDLSVWERTAFASSIGSEVWTTSRDLAVWIKKLLRDHAVVSTDLEDDMMSFHSPCTGEDFLAGYGLGVCSFNTDLTAGIKAVGHAGNALGYGAIAFYMPEYDVTVAMMDNTEKADAIFTGLNNVLAVIQEKLDKTEE